MVKPKKDLKISVICVNEDQNENGVELELENNKFVNEN